jgi:O-antigen ligase
MRDDLPRELHARAFAVGVASTIAFLTPLLGREFADAIGIHPRLVSYAALLFVLVQSAIAPQGPWFRPSAHRIHLAVLATLLCVLALFPWSGAIWVPDEPTSAADYAGHKLTRLLTNAIPTALVAVAARRFLASSRFVDGVTWATTGIAVLAAWQIGNHRDTIRGSDYAEFKEHAAFSTISVSLVFLFLQIAWCHRYLESRRHVWQPIVATLVTFVAAFLLAQRTALLLSVCFALYVGARAARGRRGSAILAAFCAVFGLWVLMDVVAGSIDLAGTISQYSAQVRRVEALFSAEDRSSALRLMMWEFGWTEGWRHPEGHGVGAFALHFHAHRYPHNTFIEALFELGVPGALFVAFLFGVTIATLLRWFRTGTCVLFSLGLLTVFSYSLKAGDLSSVGNWMFWLYLAHGLTETGDWRRDAR